MPSNLNSGFSNNTNLIQTRTSGTSMQRSTDRAVDVSGNGSDEAITITHVSGHAGNGGGLVRSTVSGGILHDTAGVARSVINRVMESDGGVNTTGTEFTEGNS